MCLHIVSLPGPVKAGSMASMTGLSRCVCNTLRMVTRAVTQLYDDALRPSGLRVTQFSILANIAGKGAANLRQLEDALAIDQTTPHAQPQPFGARWSDRACTAPRPADQGDAAHSER